MSVNLYFNNGIKNHPNFKIDNLESGSGKINGEHVFYGDGRHFTIWSEDGIIPDGLKDLVDEISWRESIFQMSRRESGIYLHETARCELVPEERTKHGNPGYRLQATAKKMEDIKVLIHKVKTGSIRPSESYEDPQDGLSRNELQQELELAQEHAQETAEMVRRFEKTVEAQKAIIEKLQRSKIREWIKKISNWHREYSLWHWVNRK